MDASWWVWSLFSLVLLVERVVPQATCDMNYTKSFNVAKQIYECRKCPDNCFSCVDGGANIGVKCSACHHGHFLTQEATCKSCTQNCASCSGETLDRCHDLEPGYYYSSTVKQLVACSEGCISCDATGACSRCKFGYLNIIVRGTENSTMPKYTCQKCQHPNCLFCEVNPFAKQICKHCAFGFGLNPANGFCIPCTEGCAVCSSNSMICNYCKSGYFKNYTSGACQQYQIENCVNYDPESQKCLGCSSGFAIEPTSGKMCVSCQPIDPHCSRCGLNPANTFSKQMACGDCFRGFFLEQSTQKCKACSEGCLYCNNENTCLGCMAGYRVLNGKCALKEPNCTDFLPSGGCTRCQSGSFLQKVNPQDISGVCKPCASTCLECDGEDQNHCTRCAVNRLKVTLDGVKWGSIVFFQERHQCVESCPHGYTPNYILHECQKDRTDKPEPVIPKQKHTFPRIDYTKDWKGLYADAYTFTNSFAKYQETNSRESDNWGVSHPEQSKSFSRSCHYRGVIKERISLDRETVWRCQCEPGYHGNNCEIEQELFKAAQNFIMAFSFDMLALVHGAVDDSLLFKTFMTLCNVPMSVDALSVTIFTFKEIMLTSFKNNTREIGQYYLTMDSILMSHVQQRIEAWLTKDDKFDIDQEKVRREMASFVDLAVENIVQVTKASPPNQKPEFAFQLGLRVFQEMDLPSNKSLFGGNGDVSRFPILHTENIFLTNGYEPRPIQVQLTNAKLHSEETQSAKEGLFSVTVLGFSHVLFGHHHGLINDLIRVIVRKNGTWETLAINNGDAKDSLKLSFPLRKEPLNDEYKKNLKCAKIKTTVTDGKPEMTVDEFEPESILKEDNGYRIYCTFATYATENEMYSVISKNTSHDQHHQKVNRVALDENDTFTLLNYVLPSPNMSNVIFSLSTICAILVFLGL